ncbi:MAG: hypothetical protein HN802_05255 [Candidatus Jacksonbacteria bacterium]|nr:hypothetical protein [Candidatus Jacksonbacteria bacterium]
MSRRLQEEAVKMGNLGTQQQQQFAGLADDVRGQFDPLAEMQLNFAADSTSNMRAVGGMSASQYLQNQKSGSKSATAQVQEGLPALQAQLEQTAMQYEGMGLNAKSQYDMAGSQMRTSSIEAQAGADSISPWGNMFSSLGGSAMDFGLGAIAANPDLLDGMFGGGGGGQTTAMANFLKKGGGKEYKPNGGGGTAYEPPPFT